MYRLMVASVLLVAAAGCGGKVTGPPPAGGGEVAVQVELGKESPAGVRPEEELRTLKADWELARKEVGAQLEAAKSDAERQKIAAAAAERTSMARFLALARRHPKSPVALDALLHATSFPCEESEFDQALDLLFSDHLRSDKLDDICRRLRGDVPGVEKRLRLALAESPHPGVRGAAAVSLGRGLMRRAAEGGADAPALGREAEELLGQVVDRFGDVKSGDRTLGDTARRMLFELRELTVGKAAPEIEGADADGVPFKLSDYRGKVVVLSWSAHWCGPCRELYPHERGLVKRLEGQPFVFLGISGDHERKTLKASMDRGDVTWRSWWDGGPQGPISRQWNVTAWPTIYVLDGRGVIRYKGVREKELDEAVDALLKELAPPAPRK